MNDLTENKKTDRGVEACQAECGCGISGQPGKSQDMAHDQTTENDIIGASHYERAESDQSKGFFARQTEGAIKATDAALEKSGVNSKIEQSIEEKTENSDQPEPYGQTEDTTEFPSEGRFVPPY